MNNATTANASETSTAECVLLVNMVQQRSYGLTGSRYRWQAEVVAQTAGGLVSVYRSATKDLEADAVRLGKAWLAKNAASFAERVSK